MSKSWQEQETIHMIYDSFMEHCDKEEWAIAKQRIADMERFDEIEAAGMQKQLEAAMFEDMALTMN